VTLEFYDKSRILLQSSFFICVRPHPALKRYIASYNITLPTENTMPAGFTVLPSGCATITITNDGNRLYLDLEGPTAKPHISDIADKLPQMLITLEFKPAGLFEINTISQNQLADEIFGLDTVNSKLCKLIKESVEKSTTLHQLVDNLDAALLGNLKAVRHPNIGHILQNIFDSKGSISVKSLSESSHYSQRQINRILQQHVGVGTKPFLRLVRINKALHLLKKPQNDLSWASDMLGFHDLSHFINDFKSICGTTPEEYRKNMSDFYNNPIRF